jgi:8-hydroxy-5-deazaflavin:NADPH oxidoreductase
MRIAIIGAGAVGTTLGQAWLKRGQDVIWGLRNPADPKHAALPKERVKAPAESVKDAEIVVIATPWSATQACVKGLGSLVGKIVIDCTNPLGMGPDGLQLVLGFETSAGEQVASWAPGTSSLRPSTPRAQATWPGPRNIRSSLLCRWRVTTLRRKRW